MGEMIIAGEPFNVIVEGDASAPAVMMSHSLGVDLSEFDAQLPALKKHCRVVRYDMRGMGRSAVSRGPYTIGQLGHDVIAILDALRLEKVDWIGHSEGGIIGLWLLTRAPERIRRAVLANTAAQIGGVEAWNERIRIVNEKGMEGLAPSVLENWFTRQYRERHPEQVRRFEDILLATKPEGYAAHCAAIRDADLRAGLSMIKQKVLVIVGRHDPVTPPGVGALLASSITGAKLVTLEAAHLSPVEAADAFNKAAVAFLTGEAERTMMRTEGDDDNKMTAPEPPKPMHVEPPKPRPMPPRPAPMSVTPPAPMAPAPAPLAPKPPAPKPPAPKPLVAAPKPAAKKAAAKKTARKAAKKAAKKTVRKAAKKKARKAVKKTARKSAAKKTARKATKRSVKKARRRGRRR